MSWWKVEIAEDNYGYSFCKIGEKFFFKEKNADKFIKSLDENVLTRKEKIQFEDNNHDDWLE